MVTQAKASKKAADVADERVDLDAPKYYINREVSLLEYQHRLLAQASDERHPLLERIRFMKIVSDNLDEFFMVRVSDLMDELDKGLTELPPDGLTPAQQLAAIRKKVTKLLEEQRRILHEQLLPELVEQGVRIVGLQDLTTAQRAGLRTYFEQQIFPVITPLAVDHGHPWPHISNLSVNLAVE
ncbi:MAG TPA: RNA degradosome polyphosphate kinase, partial [Chloroflexota bacterium]